MGKYQLSISKLKLYQTCPHRFYLRYVAKIPEKEIGNALVLGTAVHDTLDKFVETKGGIDAAKYFKDTYDTEKFKNEEKGKTVVYGDWDSYSGDIKRGTEMVKNYLSRDFIGEKDDTYSEVPFITTIDGIDDAVLVGIIDRITKNKVYEYKTTKANPEEYFIQNDLQMLGYAYALEKGKPIFSIFKPQVDQSLTHLFGSLPEAVIYIALHSLCSTRKSWHVGELYHTLVPTEEKMKYFEQEVKNIWSAIKWSMKNNIWPKNLKDPTTTPCNFCPYKKECWNGH